MMSTFDYKNVAQVVNRFRYYLAVVDGLNVLRFGLSSQSFTSRIPRFGLG